MEEAQAEEKEALESIYTGDKRFSVIDDCTYHYQIGTLQDLERILIEVRWPEGYPLEDKAQLNMDIFFNCKLSPSIKTDIMADLQTVIDAEFGNPVTFSVFERFRDNADDYLDRLREELTAKRSKRTETEAGTTAATACCSGVTATVKENKSHLSKAQKRKLYDKLTVDGQHPRGHDWMSVIRHLQQTGCSSK